MIAGLIQVGNVVQRAQAGEVALYRLMGVDLKLLYVGISKDPMVRWREHMNTPWWPQVTSYQVIWYPDRASARAAELAAIRDGQAVYNIHSTPHHGERRRRRM